MAAHSLTLLAIDDNQDNLTSLKAVVADRLPEATLLTASNGRLGLELALAEDPDVILLDIVMPGMDGYAVCRRLKEDERLQTIPVLFLTAHQTARNSRLKALEVGAEGFLSKPFDEVELTVQIRAMAKIKAANHHQRLEQDRLEELVAERTRELELELAERKRVEAALRESEVRHRTILRTAMDGFWLVDLQGCLLDVNPAYCRMSGYSESELLTMGISDLEVSEAKDATSGHIQKIINQGEERFESRHRRKDGRIFDVEISAQYWPAEGGRLVIFVQDITTRKQADERIKSQLAELQRWQDVMLGREDRVQELKREVNELCRQLGKSSHYPCQKAGSVGSEVGRK